MKSAAILLVLFLIISLACSISRGNNEQAEIENAKAEQGIVASDSNSVVTAELEIQPTPETQEQLTEATSPETLEDRERDEYQQLPARDDLDGLAVYCWANPDRCIGKGDPSAPIIVVEVSDYGCGHCRNFNLDTANSIDEQYVEDGQVYWLVMPYALRALTAPVSESALCAAEQGAFFDYHLRMFQMLGDDDALTQDGFSRAAADLDLDGVVFNDCITSGRYKTVVEQNILAASALGVDSTPSFFLNGDLVVGNYPLSAFQQIIDAMLEDSGEG